jgi:hypothetical protein
MNTHIDTAMKRGRGYWFVDGFIEMLAGGVLILLGVILLLRGMAPQDSFLTQFMSVAGEVALVKVVGIFLAVLVLWWLKDRFTYPRTGFIRSKRMSIVQLLTFFRNGILLLALPVLALLAAIIIVPPLRGALFSMPVWFPVGMGVLWAVLCILGYEWTGLRRFQVMAALIFLAGIQAGVWQWIVGVPAISTETAIYRAFASVGLLSLASGIILVISGMVTFLRYRKENPHPYQEEA